MNDLRSPMEDRPYRPATRIKPEIQATENYTEAYAENYQEYSLYERIRYSRWFPLAAVFAAVLIFSVIISYAYKQGSHTDVNASTPVVQADTANYKEKPANPGGMDVPFQDAVVFDNLQNKDAAQNGDSVESLLPPPEQALTDNTPAATPPVAAPAPVVAPPAENAGAVATAITDSEPKNAPAPVVAKTPVEQVALAPTTQADEQISTAPVKVVAPVAKPAKIATATSVEPPKAATGSTRVQLGAFRDEAAAKAAWAKMRGQYPVLASVTPQFVRADLGAKGIFYRVQGTGLSAAAAADICHGITAKGGSCIVQK